ncbi:hypothetical protein BT93_K0433 [Corymbia citriodora subsp. variegata]|nr:hypothetical protein BT93_K0433 [Corymbia citriodora subsp. variegata]KAF8006127.1 hypothetical protein BT93_K0433 [Corymbia citriodora subsp. variegata]
MSCCGGNCGWGSCCKCGSGCGGCGCGPGGGCNGCGGCKMSSAMTCEKENKTSPVSTSG